jgi:hypothetical protein
VPGIEDRQATVLSVVAAAGVGIGMRPS